MKQITTIICIAGLAGLSAPAFSFPATLANTADIPIDMKSASLSQPTHIAASGTETDNKSASQPAIQGAGNTQRIWRTDKISRTCPPGRGP